MDLQAFSKKVNNILFQDIKLFTEKCGSSVKRAAVVDESNFCNLESGVKYN